MDPEGKRGLKFKVGGRRKHASQKINAKSDESNSCSSSGGGGKGFSKFCWVPVALTVVLCMDDVAQKASYMGDVVQTSSNTMWKSRDAENDSQSENKIETTTLLEFGFEDADKNATTLLEFGFEDSQVHSCRDIRTAEYNTTNSEDAKRFKATPIQTWKLTQSPKPGVFTLEFQLEECPINYMASTFHIQASTSTHLVTGTVGRRHRIEYGCGYYNASVSIFHKDVGSPKPTCRNKTIPADIPKITLEVFWTSNFRNYQNQMHDRLNAEKIKEEGLSTEEIHGILGNDRLEFLARHLDILPGFPLDLELPIHAFVDVLGATELEDNVTAANNKDADSNILLPNCSEVPIAEWLPVGVRSPLPETKTDTWQFVSSKCRYVAWNREDLYYWLSGLRIWYFADSHGQYENDHITPIVCPEVNSKKFYGDRYECPQANNSFTYGHRYFRGILRHDGSDMDLISKPMRLVEKKACRKFLGIGIYNVTIVTTPTWLFVYEIEEALFEYVQSMKNTLQMCRRLYPTEFQNQILLWQTPTASDVHQINRDAADEWRQNHNFREEAHSKLLYQELSPYIDGIIPVFEWTLARNWKLRTRDGVHLGGGYYTEIFHLQVSAIISAMKSKGWDLPLMARDDPRARWFANLTGHMFG